MTPIELTPEQIKKLPALAITPAAIAYLAEQVKPLTPEQVLPYIPDSVAALMGSVYFKRSQWFRDQPRHTIEVCSVTLHGKDTGTTASEREVRPVLVLDAGVLGTLEELPLAEDYYDQRVLEEVRVDYF